MRIVSLLPSATEIVYALNLGEELVGITHECDWPPEARGKRIVSHSTLPTGASPAEDDRLVSESIGGGTPIYRLDHEALDLLGSPAEVVSLDPSSLDDVLNSVVQVGRVSGTDRQAEAYVAQLRDRLDRVKRSVAGLDRPRTFALEWG